MRVSHLFAGSLLFVGLVHAQSTIQQFKEPDNLGPDIPTPQVVVEDMLRLAKIKAGETVYDLGCGDGRIMITAAQRYNAKAVGIEMARDIYDRTTAKVKALGLSDRVSVVHGNALHTDLTPADVVTMYFMRSSNDRLKPILAKLRPGTRIVSHDYEIPGWKPAEVEHLKVNGQTHAVYLYEIKPAS